MADFKVVLKKAQDGYHDRDDYPPLGMTPWSDRITWTAYLEKINAELGTAGDSISKLEE